MRDSHLGLNPNLIMIGRVSAMGGKPTLDRSERSGWPLRPFTDPVAVLKRGVVPSTKAYLRELVAWGLAAFCLLTAFVVISQRGFGFLRDAQGWSWGRVAAFLTATSIASVVVTLIALWPGRPHRRSRD